MTRSGLGWPECVCNRGALQCGVHYRPRRTKDEQFAWIRAWDARVKAAQGSGLPPRHEGGKIVPSSQAGPTRGPHTKRSQP